MYVFETLHKDEFGCKKNILMRQRTAASLWMWDCIFISRSDGSFCVLTHLTHSGLLLPQAHYEDAVSLADAALGPGSEPRVRLIEDNSMYVFLLAEPAGQPILMDTLEIHKMASKTFKICFTKR